MHEKLKGISTKDLVEELERREGVECAGRYEPGEKYLIDGDGHAIVLVVRD